MPTYDYRCDACKQTFTAIHKMADPAPACPNCGGAVTKMISAPAVVGGSGASSPATPTIGGCGGGGCGCHH